MIYSSCHSFGQCTCCWAVIKYRRFHQRYYLLTGFVDAERSNRFSEFVTHVRVSLYRQIMTANFISRPDVIVGSVDFDNQRTVNNNIKISNKSLY